MSSSDSDTEQNNQKGSEHFIKPSKGGARIDTSTWPLLLKVRNHEPTFSNHIKNIINFYIFDFDFSIFLLNTLFLTHFFHKFRIMIN
jgi:hypothetical protein